MTNEDKYHKRAIIVDIPQVYPQLRKQLKNLEDYINSEPSIKNLGEYSFLLRDLTNNSIYKKLLLDKKVKDSQNNNNSQEFKQIRNKYLKKLVESNINYFPKELGLDEYQKPVIKIESKFSNISLDLNKNLVEKSRKESNLITSRKDSLLDNKRKRTESVTEEILKNNKYKKEHNDNVEEVGNADEEDNENGGEPSYINEEDEIDQPDDDDSQNYNYSYDGGNDDGGDY